MFLNDFLVVLLILSLFQSHNLIKINNYKDKYFFQEFLYKQSEAIKNREDIYVDKSLKFNQDGNINKAQTFILNNREVVVRIGSGSIKIK